MKFNSLRSLGPVLVVLMVALAVFFLSSNRWTRPQAYYGSVIEPAQLAADFELIDQHGQPFALHKQRGKVVLLFFGYSFCPDVCPSTLADYRQIFGELGEQARDLQFVYISVDPDRDTPERLSDYVGKFNPDFIALGGTEAQLSPIWEAYSIAPQKQGSAGTAGYLVDHATRIYVIDRTGQLRLTFPFGLTRDSMAADLDALLKE